MIVGNSGIPSVVSHAFVYNGGTMSNLGALPGGTGTNAYASAINNLGQITGGSDVTGDSALHPFLYSDGEMYDLTVLAAGQLAGFTNLIPNAINDNGWIVGLGTASNGETHAFLAVPVSCTTTLVAAKGDTAPGLAPATFSVFGSPAIDAAGDVAFRAIVKGGVTTANNAGIWLYKGANGTLVAHTGDATKPAPGTNNATFTKLSDPILSSGGALAFTGSLKSGTGNATPTNASGVWLSKNSSTDLVVQISDNAPGTTAGSAKITALSQIAIDQDGGLGLLANLKGTPTFAATGTGIFGTDNSGAHALLDRKGGSVKNITAFKPLPAVAGQSRSVDAMNGNVAYLRTDTGTGTRIEMATPQTSGFIANSAVSAGQSPAALGGATIKSLNEPAVNANGTAAFSLALSGTGVNAHNNAAIAVLSGATFNVAARTNDPAPNKQGTASNAAFSKLSDPVLNNLDHVAFIATLKNGGVTGTNNTGVWSDADGTMKLIVQKGDDAPGYGGGKFASFDQIVLPDIGGVVILATLSGQPATKNQGVWAVTNGKLSSVVREGDMLDVNGTSKKVSKLGIFQITPMAMGQSRSFDASTANLVYQATFTDGTWGIYKAAFP
jgi:probable HAF family extracellular repeat protein